MYLSVSGMKPTSSVFRGKRVKPLGHSGRYISFYLHVFIIKL